MRCNFSQIDLAYYANRFDAFFLTSLALFILLTMVFLVIHNDIYSRQEKEIYTRQNVMLQQQRDLLVSVAHELKTPMGTASLYMEKIARGSSMEQVAGDTLSLQREVARMRGRLHALLVYTRLEDDAAVNKTLFSLDCLAEDVFAEYVPQMEDRGIKYGITVQQDIEIYADSARIGMAVSNFLSNAMKHTRAGGEIRLTLAAANQRARLHVFNSGQHIPEEERDGIWGYRAINIDPDSAAVDTGLGLPIVKKIISQHNGRCGAENTHGGVVFWFEFPCGTESGRRMRRAGRR